MDSSDDSTIFFFFSFRRHTSIFHSELFFVSQPLKQKTPLGFFFDEMVEKEMSFRFEDDEP